MALVFTRKPLERLTFVIQTGGPNPIVTGSYIGVESFIMMAIFNKQIKLTPKGKCLVFGEDDRLYLGYIMLNKSGIPERYKPDPEDENTHFEDWYTEGE